MEKTKPQMTSIRIEPALLEGVNLFREWKEETTGIPVSRNAAIICLLNLALMTWDELPSAREFREERKAEIV